MTPGGPAAAFSLLAVLGGAGADRGALIAYITSWAMLGLQRVLVWDVPFMGAEFSLTRLLICLPLPIVAGLIAPCSRTRRSVDFNSPREPFPTQVSYRPLVVRRVPAPSQPAGTDTAYDGLGHRGRQNLGFEMQRLGHLRPLAASTASWGSTAHAAAATSAHAAATAAVHAASHRVAIHRRRRTTPYTAL